MSAAKLFLILGSAFVVVAGQANAEEIIGPKVEGASPIAMIMRSEVTGIGHNQILFYRSGGARPRLVVREATYPVGGAERIRWASTGSCRSASVVFNQLMQLDLVSDPAGLDGGGVSVARIANGQFQSAVVDEDGGSAVDRFRKRAVSELASCWRGHPAR